jgi:PAS domain S-box-containing protein
MSKNYLKEEFFGYLKQNGTLLEEIISFSKKYFFVWNFENQNHVWVSNAIWKKLGFTEENEEDDLELWKSRLDLLNTSKYRFTSIMEEALPKLYVEFKNVNREVIVTATSLYAIRNEKKEVTRIIGVLENDWNNLTLNYSSNQFEILLNLYKSSISNFDSLEALEKVITKALTNGLSISRASVWMFAKDKIICNTLFSAKTNSFESASDLLKENSPNYFKALQKGLAIVANHASENVVTSDLTKAYLLPLNIKSLLDIPVRHNGDLVGILCCENEEKVKIWTDNDVSFARSIADIFSIFIEENKRRIAEKIIHEKHDRFKFIAENITDGIFVVEDEKMVFASKPYLKMIGLTLEEKRRMRKENVLHLLHPDDVDRVNETIDVAIRNKDAFVKFIFRCKRSNGVYFWREDIMNLYYNVLGIKLRTITITRDITREKNEAIEVLKRQNGIDLQNRLLLQLYGDTQNLNIADKIDYVTKIATEGLQIDRSNYWEVEGDFLICKNLIDTARNTTDKNIALSVRDLPNYFEAMNTQLGVVADDVKTSKYTTELLDSYLTPLGITDMLDIPVRENGKMHGVLCFEHRDDPRVWTDYDISFARSLADFLSLAIEEDKRKVVEHELIENQEKLKFISENTSDGILIFEDSKIAYLSPAYTKLSGYNEERLLGMSIEDVFKFIHPDDIDRVKKIAYESLEKKVERFFYDYRLRMPNGEYSWVEDSANIIYNDEGGYSKYILISRDITQRKIAEEQLIQNEQKLQLISDNSSDGFVIMENQRIVFVSHSYAAFLGYSVEEFIGMTSEAIFEEIHPEDRQKFRNFIDYNLDNKITSFKFEFRIMSKSGEYVWREDSTNVIYDPEDKNSRYLKYIIISRDINERKLIEAKLIQNETELRLIYDNASDGIFVLEDSQIKYVSPSFLALLGYNNEEEIKGFTVEDIFSNFHPDDVVKVRPFIYDCLSKKLTAFKYEFRSKGIDGNYYWREDSANVIYGDKGLYVKYIVVTRDISARKESEREKSRLYKITEKQNQKLINFTHIVSHDIRSHTSNLSMILDLYEESQDIQEQKEYFNMLKESTNKLSDTIFYLNETVAIRS